MWVTCLGLEGMEGMMYLAPVHGSCASIQLRFCQYLCRGVTTTVTRIRGCLVYVPELQHNATCKLCMGIDSDTLILGQWPRATCVNTNCLCTGYGEY